MIDNLNDLWFSSDYADIREQLKDRLCFICYGGSFAYGTNVETSDIDIRGVCLDLSTGTAIEDCEDCSMDCDDRNYFEKDGKKLRGNATFTVEPSNTREEIDQKIKRAYLSATFVTNPFYEIAPEVKSDMVFMETAFSQMSLEEMDELWEQAKKNNKNYK